MTKMTGCYHGPERIAEFNGETGAVADTTGPRMFFTKANGPIPPDMAIDHVCGDPRCLNHRHMRLVTLRRNSGRRG
jgi:hypothetical protein